MKQSISRRQFLKASGLAAAGACAAGLLSSCGGKSGGSSSSSASGADTSKYTVLYSSQPATLNYLTTATDLEMVYALVELALDDDGYVGHDRM